MRIEKDTPVRIRTRLAAALGAALASTALLAAMAPTATATPRVTYSFNKNGGHGDSVESIISIKIDGNYAGSVRWVHMTQNLCASDDSRDGYAIHASLETGRYVSTVGRTAPADVCKTGKLPAGNKYLMHACVSIQGAYTCSKDYEITA